MPQQYPDSVTSRLGHFGYNIDRAIGSLLFRGSAQETISSQLARNRDKWWGRWSCNVLDWIDPGHADAAIRHADRLEAQDDGVNK